MSISLRALCASLLVVLVTLSRSWAAPAAPPAAPPGFNVHLVVARDGHTMWRGGAPRSDTLQSLRSGARARRGVVTFIDLRLPPTADDQSGKGGRLSPSTEKREAEAAGMIYVSMSALDPSLITRIDEALAQGDVYLHCMYGVNRTGFAMGRYATARGVSVDRTGMGERDWRQGVDFQNRRTPTRTPQAPVD